MVPELKTRGVSDYNQKLTMTIFELLRSPFLPQCTEEIVNSINNVFCYFVFHLNVKPIRLSFSLAILSFLLPRLVFGLCLSGNSTFPVKS